MPERRRRYCHFRETSDTEIEVIITHETWQEYGELFGWMRKPKVGRWLFKSTDDSIKLILADDLERSKRMLEFQLK